MSEGTTMDRHIHGGAGDDERSRTGTDADERWDVYEIDFSLQPPYGMADALAIFEHVEADPRVTGAVIGGCNDQGHPSKSGQATTDQEDHE